MIGLYETLPQQDRRAAEKRAKRLLRTTPAAPRREFLGTVRDALDTAFIKAENVVAALVYEQGDGTWWSDVVFQRGKYKIAHGVQCSSKQQALSCLKSQIAEIKATREHPLVAKSRSRGIAFEAFLWLGVRHEEFGYKYVQCPIDELLIRDLQFRLRHDIFDSMGKAGRHHAAKIARETVLRYAPDFASDDVFLKPPDGTDKSEDEIQLWREAASFLLARGVTDIDDQDETDVIYRHVLCVPDKAANVLSISSGEKPLMKPQSTLITRTRSPLTIHIPRYDEISQTIRDYGWRLMGVLPDPDESSNSLIRYIPFIYTIGNYECGLPELLMIGCTSGIPLNKIVARMRNNNRAFTDGETIDLGGKSKPKAFWANDQAREYTFQVGEYYGTNDYAVQQIVIPDTSGRYPGDPRCDVPFCLVPLLRNNGKH